MGGWWITAKVFTKSLPGFYIPVVASYMSLWQLFQWMIKIQQSNFILWILFFFNVKRQNINQMSLETMFYMKGFFFFLPFHLHLHEQHQKAVKGCQVQDGRFAQWAMTSAPTCLRQELWVPGIRPCWSPIVTWLCSWLPPDMETVGPVKNISFYWCFLSISLAFFYVLLPLGQYWYNEKH